MLRTNKIHNAVKNHFVSNTASIPVTFLSKQLLEYQLKLENIDCQLVITSKNFVLT